MLGKVWCTHQAITVDEHGLVGVGTDATLLRDNAGTVGAGHIADVERLAAGVDDTAVELTTLYDESVRALLEGIWVQRTVGAPVAGQLRIMGLGGKTHSYLPGS